MRPIDLGDPLRALNLQVAVVQPAQSITFLHLVPNIDRQFLGASVDLGPHGNLVRRANVAGGVDRELNVPFFYDGHRGPARVATFAGSDWRVFPNEVAPGAESEEDR